MPNKFYFYHQTIANSSDNNNKKLNSLGENQRKTHNSETRYRNINSLKYFNSKKKYRSK